MTVREVAEQLAEVAREGDPARFGEAVDELFLHGCWAPVLEAMGVGDARSRFEREVRSLLWAVYWCGRVDRVEEKREESRVRSVH